MCGRPASEGSRTDEHPLPDEAPVLLQRAASPGALRDAIAARAAESNFSTDTILSQLLAQCLVQCVLHKLACLPVHPAVCTLLLSVLSSKTKCLAAGGADSACGASPRSAQPQRWYSCYPVHTHYIMCSRAPHMDSTAQ